MHIIWQLPKSTVRLLPKFWEIPPIDYQQYMAPVIILALVANLQKSLLLTKERQGVQHSNLAPVVMIFQVYLIQVLKSVV